MFPLSFLCLSFPICKMEQIFLGAEGSGGKNLTLSVTYYEITDESPLGDLSVTLG